MSEIKKVIVQPKDLLENYWKRKPNKKPKHDTIPKKDQKPLLIDDPYMNDMRKDKLAHHTYKLSDTLAKWGLKNTFLFKDMVHFENLNKSDELQVLLVGIAIFAGSFDLVGLLIMVTLGGWSFIEPYFKK